MYYSHYGYYRLGNNALTIGGIENGTMIYYLNGEEKHSKMYYRHGKTWNEHLGNVPCGNYFICRLPNHKTKRIYLCELIEYR